VRVFKTVDGRYSMRSKKHLRAESISGFDPNPGRLLMVNPEFSRAQAVSAVWARHLISGVRTSQNYHLMIVADRHTVIVFGADAA
jgi:hypothetical protein